MTLYTQLVKDCKTISELSEIVDIGLTARRLNLPFDIVYSAWKKEVNEA